MGLVNMYCKLQSITFSNEFGPKWKFVLSSKTCWGTQKTISILMQFICATFRPLFLENICSRLLRNLMLISHFHNILNAPVVFDHIPLQQDGLTKSPRCDRDLCICEVKGARSVIFVKIHISFLFHLKDRHSKDVNFKFHLKQSSNFVYCSCLYLILVLCKLKGTSGFSWDSLGLPRLLQL